MPEVNDVIEITAIGHQGGLPDSFLSVFHYRVGVGSDFFLTNFSADYMDSFASDVLTPIAATLSDAFSWTDMVFQSLDNPNDYFQGTLTSPVVGAVNSDVLPPFVAWSWLLQRENRTTRHGHKRFSGVPETWVNNGQPVSGHETAIENVRLALITDVVFEVPDNSPATWTASPVIVRKTGQFAYSVTNYVLNAQLRGLGTQVSRKYGRGM